jgi:bacillithiol synthase
VPSPSETAAASGAIRDAIPFSRFPWIRPLVDAHARDFPSVGPLFTGNPADPAAWRDAITRAQRPNPARSLMATVVADQLASRQAPAPAREAAAALAQSQAVVVITGQQAGLFGGPLYTLLKALTTIQIARQVGAEHGVPVVPVFWVDAEDHDFEEIRHATVFDREMAVADIRLADLPGAGALPAAAVTLAPDVDEALTALETQLPPTEFTPALIASLRRHYAAGRSLATACASWLDELLGPHGLVVFDASDRRAKPAVASLFRQELEHPCRTAHLTRAAGEAMARLGHAAQIDPGDDVVCLFYLDGTGRRPIRYRNGQFLVADAPRDVAQLLADVDAHPERFSPNVLLRPIVQDTLFPSICYVAGPSELAYQAQLADAYRAFVVPQPLLVSRASATLIDSAAAKFLDRYQVALETLQVQDESALNRLLESQLPPGLDAAFADLDRQLAEATARLKAPASTVDPTLSGAVDTTLERLRDTLRTLQGKIVQASKKKDDTLRRQFGRTRTLVFPGGVSQERAISLAFFINRYGPGLVDRLLGILPPLPAAHYVITP